MNNAVIDELPSSRQSPITKASLASIIAVTYLLVYLLLYPSLGTAAGIIAPIPIILMAFLFGLWGGILVSLSGFGLYAVLIGLTSEPVP